MEEYVTNAMNIMLPIPIRFRLPSVFYCLKSILPERRVCGCSFRAEKKQLTNNLTLNLRCPGSVR